MGEAAGRVKRLVERNENSLEELLGETARQVDRGAVGALDGLEEQLRHLRDELAAGRTDGALDARVVYERVVGILRGAATPG